MQVSFNGSKVSPSKIVCIGKNYVAHIEEMDSEVPDNMVVFGKPTTAITDRLVANRVEPIHYEGEICFLMQGGKVAGVGFGLDLTKRETQAKLKDAGLPWERSKAFDGAALFSEFVMAPESLDNLSVRLTVNGEVRQEGGVELMIYPPKIMLEELASFTTLRDGDIVMTGTPAGVGPIKAGEKFEGAVLNNGSVITSASWIAE